MDRRLALVEYQAATLNSTDARLVVDAVDQLNGVLKPRFPQVARTGQQIKVGNLVGSVRVDRDTVLEVTPKVPAQSGWSDAIAQLLEEHTRIHVTGSRRSRSSTQRDDLTTAIAIEYARRLERALAKEGPIQFFERRQLTSRRPIGHLDVSRYVRTALLDPASFPMQRDEFTVDNDFSRALAVVARLLRRSVFQPALSARLQRLETAVLPGAPSPSYVDPSVATRRLPPQWAAFRGAWDIAAAVLRNRSIVGDPGHSVGLEVAVEPWPLLETLLTRALRRLSLDPGLELEFPTKQRYPLLTQPHGFRRQPRTKTSVEPDGVLRRAGETVATFEAKYTDAGALPDEGHQYQALTAAAALGAPLAVIVYPGTQPVQFFDVVGFRGRPARLATVGLSLYSYRRDRGDHDRAAVISEILGLGRAAAPLDPR